MCLIITIAPIYIYIFMYIIIIPNSAGGQSLTACLSMWELDCLIITWAGEIATIYNNIYNSIYIYNINVHDGEWWVWFWVCFWMSDEWVLVGSKSSVVGSVVIDERECWVPIEWDGHVI